MKDKPHHGRIADWRRQFVIEPNNPENETDLSFCVIGKFLDHPTLGKHGGQSHTSMVMKFDAHTGEIETRNSRYTLVGREI